MIKSILACICFFCAFLTSQAQPKPYIVLSKYTFSRQNPEVGSINLSSKEISIKRISLSGKDAHAFRLSKNNTLQILDQYNMPGVQYDIRISIKSSNGILSSDFKILDDSFHKNKVIAHRGAWKNTATTENSIASLNYAIQLGCFGSEFDVHLSADSVLFIHHDPSIEGVMIEKSAAKDLLKMKLANGEYLPTLADYLKAGTSQQTTKLILEIKPSAISKDRGLVLTQQVVKQVRAVQAQAWVNYISFDYDICKEILRLDPYANVAYLNGDKSPEQLHQDGLSGFDYHYNILKENSTWIQQAKLQKLQSNSWTVNDEEIMRRLLSEDIDFITTNEPELLFRLLKE